MSRSLIQTADQSVQAVAVNSIIPLGSVQRRFGSNLRLSGNAIECIGEGYYTVDAVVTAAPTAAGDVTVALFNDGVQVPGAIAYGTAAVAGDYVSLPIVGTIRQPCSCAGANQLTLVLTAGPGSVTNVSLRVEKA